MSVLFTLTNGQIISHDNFIRNVYERVQSSANRRFAFDSALFQINTPFVRQLYVNPTAPARKRMKKRINGSVHIDMKDVNTYPVFVVQFVGKNVVAGPH
jgi:hypothetical protein